MTRASRATFALLLWITACAPGDLRPPQVGDPAPEFQAMSLDGERSVALGDYVGRTLLVNIWATWCAPCRQETPYLQSVYEENQERGLMIVGVSVDSPSALDLVNEFLEEMGVTYDIVLDPGW